MKSFLSSNNNKKSLLTLIVMTILAQSTISQIAPVNLTNPLANTQYVSKQTILLPLVQRMQYNILNLNRNQTNNVTNTTPTTYVVPTNVVSDSITTIVTFLNNVLNGTAINFYNYTVLLSRINKFQFNSYNQYTNGCNAALSYLAALNTTMNVDENQALSNLNQLNNNMPTYLANFNNTIQTANPVLIQLASVNSNFGNNAQRLNSSAQGNLTATQLNFNVSRQSSNNYMNSIRNNQSAIFQNITIAINQTQNMYNNVWNVFLNRGNVTIASIRSRYALQCAPIEQILLQTVNQGNAFINTTRIFMAENLNFTQVQAINAQTNITNYYQLVKGRYLNSTTEASAFLASQTTGVNAFNTDFNATVNLINNYISNIAGFIVGENTYINTKNNGFFSNQNLASYNSFVVLVRQVQQSFSSIVDGPLANTISLNFTLDNFFQTSSSVAQSYNLQYVLPIPVLPNNLTLPPQFPPVPATTPNTNVSAPSSFVANFSVPAATSTTGFSSLGANHWAAANYTQSSQYPSLFTSVGCYDSNANTTNLFPASFPVGANIHEFSINIAQYNFNKMPSVLINVVAANIPNAPVILSVPLSNGIPNPSTVTTIPAANANQPAGTVTPPVPITNGWNNQVFGWYAFKDNLNVRLRLYLSDSVAFMASQLQVWVTIVPA